MDQTFPAPAGSRAQQRVLQGQQRQPRSVKAARDGPPDDAPGVDVGDESDVAEPAQDPHVGDVSDPELMRAIRGELPLHQVRAGIRLTSGLRGDRLAATANPFEAGGLHQPPDLVSAYFPAGPDHRVVHLPDPVDAVVLRVDPLELLDEELVS